MKFVQMPMFLTLIAFTIFALSPLEVSAQEFQENENSTTIYNLTLTLNGKIEKKNTPILANPSQENVNEQTVVTYYVGDLVVPINDEKKRSLFETGEFNISENDRSAIKAKAFSPIIDLIQSTIDSNSWEGSQAGTITPHLQNLSLVVAQTESTHHKIQSLLAKLRGLNDVVIKFESHFVIVDEASSLSGESFDATSTKNYKSLIQVVDDNAMVSSTFPEAVVFNGETSTCPSSNETESKLGPIYLQAIVTRDLKSVVLQCTDKEPLAATVLKGGVTTALQHNKQEEAKVSQVVKIANEGYVSIDVTPMLKKNSENQKAILFVRPTVSDRSKK